MAPSRCPVASKQPSILELLTLYRQEVLPVSLLRAQYSAVSCRELLGPRESTPAQRPLKSIEHAVYHASRVLRRPPQQDLNQLDRQIDRSAKHQAEFDEPAEYPTTEMHANPEPTALKQAPNRPRTVDTHVILGDILNV